MAEKLAWKEAGAHSCGGQMVALQIGEEPTPLATKCSTCGALDIDPTAALVADAHGCWPEFLAAMEDEDHV